MSVSTRPPSHLKVRPKAHRGVAFYVGLVMVLSGCGLLGYVGWQFFGTNIVSHHRQAQVVEALQHEWRYGAGAHAGASGVAGAPADLGKAQALIRIPRFGRDYVMPVLRGVSEDVLATGFGHFVGTAGPGQRGNYALAAHRVTHGEPLRNMPELRPGDKVVVETRHAVYTYRLDTDPNKLVVSFHDVWVIDRLPHNPVPGGVEPAQKPGQRLITLTTCAELFHTDNRMIAFGHLVGVVRR